jgi:glutathione peroxidase
MIRIERFLMHTLHDMSLPSLELIRLDGRVENLSDYAGRVLLVVNVASQCGFTPQYQTLQALYEQYADQGLVVMGFPCNQFGGQEPGGSAQIAAFCQSHFGVTFPVYQKCEVNGDAAHPVYQFLKAAAPGLLGSQSIKWNFTKFLVDRTGHVVDRYAPATSVASMEGDIQTLLAQRSPAS